VFVNANHSVEYEAIEGLLRDRGQRSEYSFEQLRLHPDKAFTMAFPGLVGA
jgi:hypothetical protein